MEFCRKIRSDMEGFEKSIIVHSSAGIGRTGTFIASDLIMQIVAETSSIAIASLVKRLREQRVKMVQNVEQYLFLYDIERLARMNLRPKTHFQFSTTSE